MDYYQITMISLPLLLAGISGGISLYYKQYAMYSYIASAVLVLISLVMMIYYSLPTKTDKAKNHDQDPQSHSLQHAQNTHNTQNDQNTQIVPSTQNTQLSQNQVQDTITEPVVTQRNGLATITESSHETDSQTSVDIDDDGSDQSNINGDGDDYDGTDDSNVVDVDVDDTE